MREGTGFPQLERGGGLGFEGWVVVMLLVFKGSHDREDRDKFLIGLFKDGLFCGTHGEFLVQS